MRTLLVVCVIVTVLAGPAACGGVAPEAAQAPPIAALNGHSDLSREYRVAALVTTIRANNETLRAVPTAAERELASRLIDTSFRTGVPWEEVGQAYQDLSDAIVEARLGLLPPINLDLVPPAPSDAFNGTYAD